MRPLGEILICEEEPWCQLLRHVLTTTASEGNNRKYDDDSKKMKLQDPIASDARIRTFTHVRHRTFATKQMSKWTDDTAARGAGALGMKRVS